MKFLTFGEIMLRLKAPGQECFFQSPMFEATFGGGEANVAVSLANYGEDAAFLTVLPDNAIADACKAELRRFDVDTKRIVTGEPVCFSDGAPFRTQREEVAGRIVDGLNALAAACGELEREAAEKS